MFISASLRENRMDLSKKIITVDQALDMVKSGDYITTAMGAAEPVAFQSHLHEIAGKVTDVRLTSCLQIPEYEYMKPEYVMQSFWFEPWFYTGVLRKLHDTGRVSFVPNCLSYAGRKRNAARRTDIFMSSASMPDENGNVRLSCSNMYETAIMKNTGKVILECSPNIPRVCGDCIVPADRIDHIIMTKNHLPVMNDTPLDERSVAIGQHIAQLIDDGDTIQIGIGNIPNAVCESIMNKKNLGVHTEMMTTGIMRLMKVGAVTNSRKNFNPGKTVYAFAYGTPEMYDFMNDNKDLYIGNGEWVNDSYIIGLNDNMVSVNTTIEIDLTGQCCSESIGSSQFSGSGGQTDTATGAQRSKNGRSVIALFSTTMARNPETGVREEVSKIVPALREGATVTLSRNDVDWVVTEYGAVCLRGLDMKSRVRKLIGIAHPKYREELERGAHRLKYLI
jgi:acyl-CoA hydrolase